MTSFPAVEISNLGFRYFGREEFLLSGLDLRVAPGECVGIAGENGSGKSTLVSLIAGLAQTFSEGELTGELRVSGLAKPPLVVLQDPDAQIVCDRVGAELKFFAEHTVASPLSPTVGEALKLSGAESLRDRFVHRLSYGQKQRVVFASAWLCGDPRLIVLDEPFAHLDEEGLGCFVRVLEGLKRNGSAVVLVGHDLGRAAGLIDRCCLLRAGRLVPLPSVPPPPAPAVFPAARPSRPRALFSVGGLSCRDSRGEPIFKPFTREFPEGTICGLSGPNGCGKSVLAAALAGIFPVESGVVRRGDSVLDEKRRRRLIKVVTQNPFYQLLYRTGARNVRGAVRRRRGELPAELGNPAELLGVEPLLSRDILHLSRGEALRVALLCAVLEGPDLLILDEALVGLDREGTEAFLRLSALLRGSGKCVLLISHLPELLEGVCDVRFAPLEAAS